MTVRRLGTAAVLAISALALAVAPAGAKQRPPSLQLVGEAIFPTGLT